MSVVFSSNGYETDETVMNGDMYENGQLIKCLIALAQKVPFVKFVVSGLVIELYVKLPEQVLYPVDEPLCNEEQIAHLLQEGSVVILRPIDEKEHRARMAAVKKEAEDIQKLINMSQQRRPPLV